MSYPGAQTGTCPVWCKVPARLASPGSPCLTEDLFLFPAVRAGATREWDELLFCISALQNYTAAAAAGSSAGVLGSWGPEGIVSICGSPVCYVILKVSEHSDLLAACDMNSPGSHSAVHRLFTLPCIYVATRILHSPELAYAGCLSLCLTGITGLLQPGPLHLRPLCCSAEHGC
jgi:hypothetical protein